MSSLVHLPSGPTLDYWWERLRGKPQRKRFLLTKIIEVTAYGFFKAKRPEETAALTCVPVLQLKPMLKKNGVKQDAKAVVVVPTRCQSRANCAQLERLMERLVTQSASLIVVNDGSKCWPKLPTSVHQLDHSNGRGPAAARNTGIAHALKMGADIILMTDMDCVPQENWVAATRRAFQGNPYAHAFSGLTLSLNATWMDRYHDINGTLNGRRFKETPFLLYGPTCNLAISRELAQAVSFDESFRSAACEDIDFCFRALERGFRVLHAPEMVVHHDYQYRPWAWGQNLIMFVRQFGKYAQAEATLLAKCPGYYTLFGDTTEISSLLEV
ncbi:MAG: glycosyltransferase [Candidatus Methylacidiphilales bacterium]|nr:glycosyltransferase [Candidatus Methylacidiphilales bacterium]